MSRWQDEFCHPDGVSVDMGALEEELHGSITGWRAFVSEFNREAIAIVSAVVVKVCATSLGEMPSSKRMQVVELTRPFCCDVTVQICEEERGDDDVAALHSPPRLPFGLPCSVHAVNVPSLSSMRRCVDENLQSHLGRCINLRGIVMEVHPVTFGSLNQLVCPPGSKGKCSPAVHRQLGQQHKCNSSLALWPVQLPAGSC